MTFYSLNTDLFWSKVDKQDDCWLWQGSKQNSGYGMFHVRVPDKWTYKLAHRLSYEMCVGKIPDGMDLDHICFNKLCVCPDHLRPVTRKQNMEHQQGPYVTSKSGVRGVHWSPQYKHWIARVGHNGTIVYVGGFSSIEAAESAVIAKRNELFTHNDEAHPPPRIYS